MGTRATYTLDSPRAIIRGLFIKIFLLIYFITDHLRHVEQICMCVHVEVCGVKEKERRKARRGNIIKYHKSEMSRVKLSHESAAEAGPVIIGMLCATSMYLSNVYRQRGGGSLHGVLSPVTFTFWVAFATMCSIPYTAWLHSCPMDVCACICCMVQLAVSVRSIKPNSKPIGEEHTW